MTWIVPSALRLAWEEANALRLDLTGLAPAQPSTPLVVTEIRAAARRAWLEWLPFAQVAALDELAGLAFRHPALIEKAVRVWSQLGWPRMRARLTGLQGKEIAEALDDFIGQMADDLPTRAPLVWRSSTRRCPCRRRGTAAFAFCGTGRGCGRRQPCGDPL